MIEMSFPNAALEPVELRLQATKGIASQPAGVPKSFKELLCVGVPQVRPLLSDELEKNEELRRFLKAEGGRKTYHLVRISCSFNPAEEDRIVEAWLQVDLSNLDERSEQTVPIAWALQPLRAESRPSEVESAIKIGADLKFLNVELNRSAKAEVREAILQAHNVLAENPYWQFRETGADRLDDIYHLDMVVQSPKGVPTRGALSVRANVRRLAMHVIPYKAALDSTPVRAFELH